MATLYIIGGCNGAGKTTCSYELFPDLSTCKEYVNADVIAYNLCPEDPQEAAIKAGKLMLHRIKELMHQGVDFAFETTLAGKVYQGLIEDAIQLGYKVKLMFFWLQNSKMAIERVAARVAKGGHHTN